MIPIRLKSKTNLFATAVTALGLLQANLPQVAEALGDKQGFVYIALGIAMVVLREFTTTPVTERPNVS